MNKFSVSGGTPPIPPVGKTLRLAIVFPEDDQRKDGMR